MQHSLNFRKKIIVSGGLVGALYVSVLVDVVCAWISEFVGI
jgi:hypothetical protein